VLVINHEDKKISSRFLTHYLDLVANSFLVIDKKNKLTFY